MYEDLYRDLFVRVRGELRSVGEIMGDDVSGASRAAGEGVSPEQVKAESPSEQLAWDMFFGNVVAIQLHPGFRGEPDLDRCAYLADRMLLVRRKRRL